MSQRLMVLEFHLGVRVRVRVRVRVSVRVRVRGRVRGRVRVLLNLFFTAFSVLPGNNFVISHHRFPNLC